MSIINILDKLEEAHPEISFEESDFFAWSFEDSKISYCRDGGSLKSDNVFENKLLHELAHAQLKHSEFKTDLELLSKEASAWLKTKSLCQKYGVEFNKRKAERSMDSYRLWASSRSECTNSECKKTGLQYAKTSFICLNCNNQWRVGSSRFKRTYRH